ncbi:hypothetical protein O181_117050 [Austropuccinia psidii MF-1]|uniref:Uncharacterized protein n=1 Tax=Austropuccinia psidii MF-1 TaxID=1389203 RepID=A0A9Q3K9K9_9BASI|nr:hypothetical protein [Austropuccinia psidii MF-1]
MGIIHQYGLDAIPGGLTTNNVSVNNRMAQLLKEMMEESSEKQQAIGCMTHTLHLAAREGLNSPCDGMASMTTQEECEYDRPMLIANIVNHPDGADLNHNTIITQIRCLDYYL